jgi:cysteine synthase
MPVLGLETHVVDRRALDRTVRRFRDAAIVLPTIAELAEPAKIPQRVRRALAGVGPDDAHPLNLFRVHWHNGRDRVSQVPVPVHVDLPGELTGVDARIVVAVGDVFPMIRAHKVLAAYGCLAPRVAISRLMQCRGVAVLPEGMSRERFAWLEDWVTDPGDIIRTPGTESNVKEIYDKCAELSQDAANVIFNQFAEFGNHLVHYACTGPALARVFESLRAADPALRLRAFVSASGSAGTLAAGDHLKEAYAAAIVAAEALECPTMLYNGFGDHNIQGIGDKHIPLIHNVMNTDIVTAVSDEATDHLGLLFSAPAGLDYLRARRKVPEPALAALSSFGLSSICNIVAAVKTARYLGLGSQDVVMTVATDGADMYGSEREQVLARDYPGGFEEAHAAEAFGRWMLAAGTDHLLETSLRDRQRIFDLGYYTWVEQQGVGLADFTGRRSQAYWVDLRDRLASWDGLIEEFNARTRVADGL